jgi:endonuclease YncB( thermonuclease family)
VSLRRPRRIFRTRWKIAVAPGLWRVTAAFAVAAGGLATSIWGASGVLLGHSSPRLMHVSAESSQVAVIGGDTLRLRDTVVHLDGVQAPERGQGCQVGGGADCGSAAASELAQLVHDHNVDCQLHGEDGMGRPFGHCQAAGIDLNRAVVLAGWAVVSDNQPGLEAAETEARSQHRGIWAGAR